MSNSYSQCFNAPQQVWDQTWALTSPGCPSDGKQLMLVFEDHFNNADVFENNWIHSFPNSYAGAENWKDPNNSTVSGGTLKLVANNNAGYHLPAPGATTTEYFEYTGGEIYSRRSFGIGAYEIKCKIPRINRGYASFWAWHYDLENPNWQEIDVFEFVRGEVNNGNPSIEEASSKVNTTWHMEQWLHQDPHPQNSEKFPAIITQNSTNFADGGWHTFKMEWNGSQIITSVDGNPENKLYRYYNKLPFNCRGTSLSCGELGNFNDESRGPVLFPESQNPMHLIASLIVDAENNPSFPDDFPLTMEVEWIKVWQFANCNEDVQICGNIPQDYPSIKVAKNITVAGSCNVVVNLTQNFHDYNFSVTEFLATEEVALLPGFEVKGAELSARIVDCQADVVVRSGETDIDETDIFETGSEIHGEAMNVKLENIQLTPNPNNGDFNLSIQSSQPGSPNLYIIDLAGRILITQSISLQEGLTQISMSKSELPAGVYFIKADGFDEPVKMIITK